MSCIGDDSWWSMTNDSTRWSLWLHHLLAVIRRIRRARMMGWSFEWSITYLNNERTHNIGSALAEILEFFLSEYRRQIELLQVLERRWSSLVGRMPMRRVLPEWGGRTLSVRPLLASVESLSPALPKSWGWRITDVVRRRRRMLTSGSRWSFCILCRVMFLLMWENFTASSFLIFSDRCQYLFPWLRSSILSHRRTRFRDYVPTFRNDTR